MIRILRHAFLQRGCLHCNKVGRTLRNNGFTALRCMSVSPVLNAEPIPVEAIKIVENAATSLPEVVADIATVVVDPPFVEIGLAAGWWPWHFIQSGLESFYIATGSPWWLTIVLGTLTLRVVTFPIFIKTRKFAMKSSQVMPLQQKMMAKFQKLQRSSDPVQQALGRQKLQKFFKKHGTGPVTTLVNSLPMPIIFMSSITAIRQMSAVPVPSLEATSLLWMESLVAGDPYRVLPLVTGAVIGITIHSSFKSGMVAGVSPSTIQKLKFVPLLPIVLMPLLMGHLPCSITLYILTNTCFTYLSTLLLQNETVKQKLKFPVIETPKVSQTQQKKGIFSSAMTEAKEKATKKDEQRIIKKEKKDLQKQRKKELKNPPPITYAIGTEAFKKEFIPDFEEEWRPPRPSMFNN